MSHEARIHSRPKSAVYLRRGDLDSYVSVGEGTYTARVAVGLRSGGVAIFRVDFPGLLQPQGGILHVHGDSVQSLAFSPCGRCAEGLCRLPRVLPIPETVLPDPYTLAFTPRPLDSSSLTHKPMPHDFQVLPMRLALAAEACPHVTLTLPALYSSALPDRIFISPLVGGFLLVGRFQIHRCCWRPLLSIENRRST